MADQPDPTSSTDSQPAIIELVAEDPNLTNLSKAPELVALEDLAADACNRTGVIIDVSQLSLVTSRGLAELVLIRRNLKAAAGRIILAGACDQIERIVSVCHLDNYFGCTQTVVEARERLGGA